MQQSHSLALTLVVLGLFPTAAIAQIVPDTSLPINSVVAPNGNIFTLEGGTAVGGNLFHSFQEFSVPTGTEAFFNNAPNIENIFTRVTGGSLSNIDGIIRANGVANLFLLNPNGIVFNSNARLEIGGSFYGTTAESIRFGDGMEFSATHSQTAPLLSINVPVGLQLGTTAGEIVVRGAGHQVKTQIFTPIEFRNTPTGLTVRAGHTLGLIGGAVNLSGGIASAVGGGHLEVGSVSEGSIRLVSTPTGWVGDYSEVGQFNDISLARQSLLNASGINGSIQLQGRNIRLTEGSTVVIQDLGSQTSIGISINATGALSLTGIAPDGSTGSRIGIDSLGTVRGSDLTVNAAQLSLQDGGQLGTTTFTAAPGGNTTIDVSGEVEVTGFNPLAPPATSVIATVAVGSGNAGNIAIATNTLRVLNSASISAVTVGSGQAGSIEIDARDTIEVADRNPIGANSSAIGSSTLGAGDAKQLLLNTSRLVIRDGGWVGSSALATGSAGSVIVNASQSVEVRGRDVGSIAPSRIVSSAEILDPIFQTAFGLPPIPTGNSGSLVINTPSLRIADGATVTVRNDGPGRAGDLQIGANTIVLEDGNITASTASGNGGNIRLTVGDNLQMRRDSSISATAGGTGNGGNVSVDAPVFVGLENSDIVANAVRGEGGNINIETQGIFGLENRPELTPKSDISASSELGVDGVVTITNPEVEPSSGLVNFSQDTLDPAEQVVTGCEWTGQSEFIATRRGGLPTNPDRPMGSSRTWSDVRDLSAFRGERVEPASVPTPEPLLEATGWTLTAEGTIELVANPDKTAAENLAPFQCNPLSSS